MNADGFSLTPLYDAGVNTFSYGSRAVADRILFSSDVQSPGSSKFQIYSIEPDGSGVTRLTNNALRDAFDYD